MRYLSFFIDFDRRPYNTLALPCQCVIDYTAIFLKMKTSHQARTHINECDYRADPRSLARGISKIKCYPLPQKPLVYFLRLEANKA